MFAGVLVGKLRKASLDLGKNLLILGMIFSDNEAGDCAMKPYIPFFLILLLMVGPLIAESTWEGTTTASRYGEFPDSGNYGASNSFSRNTIITVTNLVNGQSTTVIIVDRLDDPGLFLLLSRDAAVELGVSQAEIVQVRARLEQPRGASSAFRESSSIFCT